MNAQYCKECDKFFDLDSEFEHEHFREELIGERK